MQPEETMSNRGLDQMLATHARIPYTYNIPLSPLSECQCHSVVWRRGSTYVFVVISPRTF